MPIKALGQWYKCGGGGETKGFRSVRLEGRSNDEAFHPFLGYWQDNYLEVQFARTIDSKSLIYRLGKRLFRLQKG